MPLHALRYYTHSHAILLTISLFGVRESHAIIKPEQFLNSILGRNISRSKKRSTEGEESVLIHQRKHDTTRES